MKTNIHLYHFEKCPFCEKARRAFRFLNMDYESHIVNPKDRSEVIELSGQEKVPMILDGDNVVYDSTRLIEYLDEEYAGDLRLIPSRNSERGETYILNSYAEEVWGGLTYQALLEIDENGNRLDNSGKKTLQEAINAQAAILNDYFDERIFAVGGSVTLADFALSAFPSRIIEHTGMEIPESFDHFWHWYKRVDTQLAVPVDME